MDRWERYKRIIFIRLREIEEELDLRHNRNLQYVHMRHHLGQVGDRAVRGYDASAELDAAGAKMPKTGTIQALKNIALVLSLVWFGLIAAEFYYTFLVR